MDLAFQYFHLSLIKNSEIPVFHENLQNNIGNQTRRSTIDKKTLNEKKKQDQTKKSVKNEQDLEEITKKLSKEF